MTRLFYEGAIRAVGTDGNIAEAGVAKSTFDNHFPSSMDLNNDWQILPFGAS
ncbi:TetR/AcrR family transcriptional regulator [Neorhizobium sp. BETTINA12A]|nr:TetR/AcrR family transcriptional regulator [Neorhizobium sp. BETTINA12A]